MHPEITGSPGFIALVVSGFVATNIDNLLILVGLLGADSARHRAILVAYFFAAGAILVICIAGAALGEMIDPALLGYLGALPICLGLYLLCGLWFRGGKAAAPPTADVTGAARGVGVSTFLLMLSNSGDSVAVFLPLAAESSRDALFLFVASYLLTTLAWLTLARLAVGHRHFSSVMRRFGEPLVPWILILGGTYILLDTATDRLLAATVT